MGPYKPLRNWVDEFIPYYTQMLNGAGLFTYKTG